MFIRKAMSKGYKQRGNNKMNELSREQCFEIFDRNAKDGNTSIESMLNEVYRMGYEQAIDDINRLEETGGLIL